MPQRSADAEQLDGLTQVGNLGVGLLLPGIELLLGAVDPDDRDLLLQARLHVVVVAGRDVDPALLGADAPLALGEVRRVGLVGAHLLRGDDQVEVERDVPPRLAQQLVVDVGDQPDLMILGHLLERRVRLRERLPPLHRVGQEARARRLQRPAQLLGDAHGGAPQHLGVELVGPGLDLLGDLMEEGENLIALDGESVTLGFLAERLERAGVPIDQGPIDVEGHKTDCFRYRHVVLMMPFRSRNPRPGSNRARVTIRMDLLEYQGKQLFARHGVPVPEGKPARSVEDAVASADEIGYPCAVKAQVQIGGRGKLGGIKIANDRHEAEEHARAILGMDIRGLTVHELWIEGASQIASEYYASVVFDRSAKAPLVMLSTKGGMDIEAVADEDPDAIASLHVDPLLGFQDFHGRRLAFEAGVDADVVRPVGAMLAKLYQAFIAEDATLVEVNPMIVTPERDVKALDAKVTLDDNALYRHPENAALRDVSAEDPQERMAKERGLTYVKLDGDIGILANGAGLSMSTLDVVAEAGGTPANFLDAGGGSRADAITAAVEVILSDTKVKAVLFNIFGGITRCDEVAKGLIEAFGQINPTVPFVVRLDGTNGEEGRKLLAEAALPNVHTESTMDGAAAKVVELARGAAVA